MGTRIGVFKILKIEEDREGKENNKRGSGKLIRYGKGN